MKKYEIVNDITTETYSLTAGSGVWTEQQLLNAGMAFEDIATHVTLGNLFEITFLAPPPMAPPLPPT